MANSLPSPSEGSVYTNPTTGTKMKYSSGCWKPIGYLPTDGSEAMQDTLWSKSHEVNGVDITADNYTGGAQTLYINGEPVAIDDGLEYSIQSSLRDQNVKLGRTKYYQEDQPSIGDSYNHGGALWFKPSTNQLHFYNDSDAAWVQL